MPAGSEGEAARRRKVEAAARRRRHLQSPIVPGQEPPAAAPLEPLAPLDLPHTWRPLGPRLAGMVAGGGLLVISVLLWVGFDDQTKAAVTVPQRLTVVGIYLLAFACLFALMRSRAVATADGLLVVNGYRTHRFAWAQIVAVHLAPGAPWVTVDLSNGEVASVMAIQGSDGRRARVAVRQLRALVDGA